MGNKKQSEAIRSNQKQLRSSHLPLRQAPAKAVQERLRLLAALDVAGQAVGEDEARAAHAAAAAEQPLGRIVWQVPEARHGPRSVVVEGCGGS